MSVCIGFLLVVSVGCAHRIDITPPVTVFEGRDTEKIPKNVGYYIAPADLEREVETPAGGGDRVKYRPYKESEGALRAALDGVFEQVYAIPSPGDTGFITSKQIAYVFMPIIETDSVGRSPWIWPPADFTVRVECRATDGAGILVWETNVTGEAHLALGRVSADHSRAAREAVADAFLKLQQEISEAHAFR